MALRRPPTRIELKADDVDEYDKIMKERRLIAEQQAMREKSQQQKPGSDFGATPSSQLSSQKRFLPQKGLAIGKALDKIASDMKGEK